MKTAFVVAEIGTYAGAGPLVAELRRSEDWQVNFVVAHKDEPQQFWRSFEATVLSELSLWERWALRSRARSADLTIVAGTPALDIWMRVLQARRPGRRRFSYKSTWARSRKFAGVPDRQSVAIMVTDSFLLSNTAKINALYNRFRGAHFFVMPDLIPFVERSGVHPFFPGTATPQQGERTARDGPLRIGHSPSSQSRFDQKGTAFIQEVLGKHKVEMDLITGLEYSDALARKAQLDLFIDQISYPKFEGVDWCGGLGKSGLEAMAMGVAVVTSGNLADTAPEIPAPPVVMTDRARFEADMLELLADPARVAALGRDGKDWFERYASPTAQLRFILDRTGHLE